MFRMTRTYPIAITDKKNVFIDFFSLELHKVIFKMFILQMLQLTIL